MKSFNGWKLLLVFSFFTLHCFAQKEKVLIVPLKSVVDTGMLGSSVILTNAYSSGMNYDTFRLFKGIPASFKEKIIKEIDFQPAQAMYEYYLRLAGKMPPQVLMEGLQSYHSDTLQLSRRPIRHVVFLVTGIDSLGNRMMIVDANNNLDFSDDKMMVYDSVLLKKSPNTILSLMPNCTLQVQYACNGKVYDGTYNLKLTPVWPSFHCPTPIEEKLKIIGIANETKQGSFAIGSSNYVCAAVSHGRSTMEFDRLHTTIDFTEKDASGKIVSKSEHRIGDTIFANLDKYVISGISTLGDSLRFSFVGKGAFVFGIDSDKVAYNIRANDLNGGKFDLQQYRGKYVLLDFWGTWCGPCVASIPELVNIANEFKSDLQVVSIALDQTKNIGTIKEMIRTREMNWIHIFQDYDDALKAPIVSKFNVHNFPTQILIDPNGVIILRCKGSDKGVDIRSALKRRLADKNHNVANAK